MINKKTFEIGNNLVDRNHWKLTIFLIFLGGCEAEINFSAFKNN